MSTTTGLPTTEAVFGLLRGVVDPELGSDIVELGMAKGVTIDDNGLVTVTIALTTSGCPLRAQIQKDVRARVGGLPGVTKVKLSWTELTADEKAATMAKARLNISREAPDTEIPPTTKVIMVASGKGGVGKSSLTVNLAAGLAATGLTVGVLDADIWGFSVPRMLGLDGRLAGERLDETEQAHKAAAENPEDKPAAKIIPLERPIGEGLLKVVSMGFLVADEQTSLNWRGLILNRAVRHFLEDVRWGHLDYLLIDMPPGTGDVQMGLAKMLPRAEVLIVTTPAKTAQTVAVRVGHMARSYYLRIAGVIENMSVFVNEAGTEYPIFGSGGGQVLADDIGVPLLGKIPIDGAIADGGDNGAPIVLGTGPAAEAMRSLTQVVLHEAVPLTEMAGCTAVLLQALHDGPPADAGDGSPVALRT